MNLNLDNQEQLVLQFLKNFPNSKEKKELINLKDQQGQSSAYFAIKSGSNDVLKVLLKCGFDIKSRDYRQRTILHLASRYQNIGILQIVMRQAQFLELQNIDLSGENLNDEVNQLKRRLLEKNQIINIQKRLCECFDQYPAQDVQQTLSLFLQHEYYAKISKKFVNLKDIEGRTALHIAAKYELFDVLETLLIKFKAFPFMLDIKGRSFLDILKKGSESYQKFIVVTYDIMMKSNKKKFKPETNQTQSVYQRQRQNNDLIPLEINLNHIMVKKNLILISNDHLQRFIINGNQDNALTFSIRVGNFGVFQFLLNKGVSPLSTNDEGKTAIHIAIQLQQLEYLVYLFEGVAIDHETDKESLLSFSHNLSSYYQVIACISNKPFIWQSFQSLYVESKDSYLPFHEAIVQGNLSIFRYITKLYQMYDFLKIHCHKGQCIKKSQLTFAQVKEIKVGKNKFSPILLSVIHSHYDIFLYLYQDLKCNIETVCKQQNNVLHHAILSQNESIISKIVEYDTDFGILRRQQNIKGQTPQNLSAGRYDNLLTTVWDLVGQGNIQGLRELVMKHRELDIINQQTKILGNTPLHLAIINQSPLLIKTILKLGGSPLIRNKEGLNAIDISSQNKCSLTIINLMKERIDKRKVNEV